MSTIYFGAIIEGNARDGYSVFFPDLPGLASAGDTLQAAAIHAGEGLRGHVGLMIEEGLAMPVPSELDAIARDPEVEEAARILVPVEVPSSKVLRVNVTLPEDLLQRIDAKSPNRSRFLAEAAERALAPGAVAPKVKVKRVSKAATRKAARRLRRRA
jgi:predicted RNase H-like HicB family nuclease